MTDPQWRRAYELFERLGALPQDAARAALESSSEDPEVVDEVSAMIGPIHRTEHDSDVISQEPRPHVQAGCVIGRYEVIALIGRGSTGDVYSGRDRELGRTVALKFMSAEYADLGSSATRFLREAQASSALNHPNIITVHEVVTWNSSPVIVMELVDGTALRGLCGQPLAVGRAVHIGQQIMRALAFAHSIGIVHRDLKPENVMVRPDGYVKILDFGLARKLIFDQGTQNLSSTAGLPVGTLRYMSPEQCRGESATAASDVFAAGIVLFEMLAGRHPFSADSPLDTAHAIVWSNPPALTAANLEVTPALEDLITRMLAKDAHARPSSAEVAEALELQAGHTAGTPPARRPMSRYLIGSLVAVIVLALGFWFTRSPRESGPASRQFRVSPVASLPGAERQPSISADGTRVAFAYREDRNAPSHIYVKILGGAAPTRLTSDASPDVHPVFSPDGTRIAFLRRTGGRLRVMILPAAGGVAQQAGEVVDSGRKFSLMTWGAEGKTLFIADSTGKSPSEVAIFQISVDTGARRQITFPPPGVGDYMPAVSPDGRRVGYARLFDTGRGDLWDVALAGGQERRLTDVREIFFCWSWTRDGRDLLISYRRSGQVRLWKQPVAGGSQVRVAGLDEPVMELSAARNAGLLVYGSSVEESYNVNIWRYAISPSPDPPKPLIASAAVDADPRYSPDGTRIAFSSTRSGQTNIWICASDGTELRQLTSPTNDGSPSWSPDGRWIAFDSRSPEIGSGIFVVDLLGGKPERLAGTGAIVPTWSRDGRWIYFSSDAGGGGFQIWKVALDGGEPVQLTRNGGFESFESADGRFLYYTKRGSSGFWRMPIQGGPETFVSELSGVANRNWDNSPQGLYFLSRSSRPLLQLFPPLGRPIRQMAELPMEASPAYRGLAVSPDGRSFLFMQADLAKSNLMAVSNYQ